MTQHANAARKFSAEIQQNHSSFLYNQMFRFLVERYLNGRIINQ